MRHELQSAPDWHQYSHDIVDLWGGAVTIFSTSVVLFLSVSSRLPAAVDLVDFSSVGSASVHSTLFSLSKHGMFWVDNSYILECPQTMAFETLKTRLGCTQLRRLPFQLLVRCKPQSFDRLIPASLPMKTLPHKPSAA